MVQCQLYDISGFYWLDILKIRMEYIRFTLCLKIFITIKVIVPDHVFSRPRQEITNGCQPFQSVESFRLQTVL